MEAVVQLLGAIGLAVGTLDYALLIRRRGHERRRQADLTAAQVTGVQGLVRVMLSGKG